MTNVLAESGVALEESANKSKEVAINLNEAIHQISSGAVEQAGDVERSSQQIIGIRQNINQIFESVTNLSEKSDEMHSNGKEANENMNELTRSSDKTIDAFHRIEEQVRKTDESVVKIQDAISLIASVADQINLLSLNASIEAARAGEAGKGFAVVATEVAKLASQTNESASIIEGIIQSLSEESNRTVETINEAGEFIKSQKGDIDSTHDIFSNVSTGIEYTQSAVIEVLKQSQACEDSSATIVEIMTNLSAISEENAASAETTSSAMTQLNSETARLAETSAELKHIADTLKQDLDFFKI
jgi:methyl-accepting chemotaxis protein